MTYDDMTAAKVLDDFVRVRGDLAEEYSQASLLDLLHKKFMAPILDLHRPVDNLGTGVKTCAQQCRDLNTGAIYSFPCPTYSAASVTFIRR